MQGVPRTEGRERVHDDVDQILCLARRTMTVGSPRSGAALPLPDETRRGDDGDGEDHEWSPSGGGGAVGARRQLWAELSLPVRNQAKPRE